MADEPGALDGQTPEAQEQAQRDAEAARWLHHLAYVEIGTFARMQGVVVSTLWFEAESQGPAGATTLALHLTIATNDPALPLIETHARDCTRGPLDPGAVYWYTRAEREHARLLAYEDIIGQAIRHGSTIEERARKLGLHFE